MMTRPRNGVLIACFLVILGWSRPAEADLVLSFEQMNYTIDGVGNTTALEVLVAQTPHGTQVGPGNELLTAGITVSFATTGAATVVSTADVTPGPAWDSSGVSVSASGPNTLINLVLGQILSPGFDLSSPVLLGTFIFTGQSIGMTMVDATTISPGSNFITVQDDVVDPTNTASATISVVAGAIPEPSAVVLWGIGGLVLGAGWLRFRPRTVAASAQL